MSQEEHFYWLTELKRSIQLNQDEPHHRFVQLASVTQNGEPRNRTMVFRGFDPDDDSIVFCTDQRSAKIDELVEGGLVELCWYFLSSREQYRLRGEVQFIDNTQKRGHMWSRLSLETRAQFFWPTPLELVIENDGSEDHPKRIPEALESSAPSHNFVLFKIDVNVVDYLSLTEDYHRMICKRSDHGWSTWAVNP
jgi:PPOX class probable FMN-dependent enzyme